MLKYYRVETEIAAQRRLCRNVNNVRLSDEHEDGARE